MFGVCEVIGTRICDVHARIEEGVKGGLWLESFIRGKKRH